MVTIMQMRWNYTVGHLFPPDIHPESFIKIASLVVEISSESISRPVSYLNTEWRQYIGITRKLIFFNQSAPFCGYLQFKAGTPKLKWNQRWRRVAKIVKCRRILKDNSANLLHTGDDKKADKWIDDIRWTVMVFDATFVREDILWSHRSGSTDNGIHFRPPISNDGNYFINKVMLKCWTKLLLYSTSLLVIRNEPHNYISLTENISNICIILLSGATRWRFSRLKWGYYKQFYIMRLLSKMCGQVVYLYFQQINA